MIFALMMTMLLGDFGTGSWNFVLWGFVHGLLLIIHRFGKDIPLKANFSRNPIGILISWFITQVFVFFTWLIFRIEDTSILTKSMKTFFGIGGHFDLEEMYTFLPEIKLLTGLIVVCFILLHGVKLGGGKMWLSRRHPVIWE